jgi:hypothetical protein
MGAILAHHGLLLGGGGGGSGPGVHRYWRIYVTANNGNVSFGAGADEIKMATTVGGANVAGVTGANATASSIINGSNTAPMAFDLSFATRWLSAAGLPQWIYIDFGAGNEKEILQFSIAGPQSAITASPKDFTFDYSDNATAWTTV